MDSIIVLLLPSYSNSIFNSKNIYGPPVTLSYDRGSMSYTGQPSTRNTNQSGSSSSPRTQQQVHHNPQRRVSTLSMMTNRPPIYRPNPFSDESDPMLPSSPNGYNAYEINGRSPRFPPNTAGADSEIGLTSTVAHGRGEGNVSAWNRGYPQPLRFVPII